MIEFDWGKPERAQLVSGRGLSWWIHDNNTNSNPNKFLHSTKSPGNIPKLPYMLVE